LPHVLFILQSKEFQNDKRDREHLVQRVTECLYSDGRYDQAGGLKNDDEEMLNTMAWIGLTHWKQGRWTEAEKLQVQVMETFKTVLGPEHHSTLTSMNNLALTYRAQGRWAEAEKLFVQVVDTRKTV
jgi:tetratricopeptide repeat protein